MLRVLQVVTDMRRGGLETMLMNYYRQIDRDNIQFDFLTHRSYRSAYDDEIEELGGVVYHLPKLDPFSTSYKKALGDFFDEHPEYQIVHVHQDCLSSVILKVAKAHGVKIRIAHSHANSQNKDIKYPIKLYFKRFIPKYATHLMACSCEAGKWMFGTADFIVLNNAINAMEYGYDPQKREEQRKNLGLNQDEILVGHVGRFSPPKNHMYLLEIFSEIQRTENARLILVGDGMLRSEIAKKIRHLGIEDRVIQTGVRPDVANLLQAMDVFVLPSIYEGLGIVAIEAQAAGIPCIISDTVSAEACITKETIKLSLQDTPEVWASKAIELSRLPRRNTYEEICDAGYDIVSNAKKLETFYRTVAEEN